MIKFENVTKKYTNRNMAAVNNVNLHIKEGEICMLVGPSGSGKTTVMKMINKLIKPNSGEIFIDGKNIEEIDSIELRLNIGYIIQDIGLFPHMTIFQNIAIVPTELGWEKDKIEERVDELLELMELDPQIYRSKKPRELSGGQKQRVGVARALAGNPKIMLMDEPFGALDPITRAKLQNEFLIIQEKIRKTIVFVTHDVDEAIKMGDKIAVLKEGSIVQFATPSEILSNPANDFVSELIGSNSALKMMNLIKCESIMQKVYTMDANLSFEEAKKMFLQFNVEQMVVAEKGVKKKYYIEFKEALKKQGKVSEMKKEITNKITIKATVQDALSEMFSTGKKYIFIEDGNREIKGIVTMDNLLKVVSDYGNMDI
ncbi:betaine/proline/choline family ABC transporter ATP-binding protein [Clostridium algidicarnis]|uniref:betaine/proline/choline family ABC transporter ATP-binding protein n=1 Tax=Clostridium algidicarnis TaxID=37659 RepID=UPI003FD7CCFC